MFNKIFQVSNIRSNKNVCKSHLIHLWCISYNVHHSLPLSLSLSKWHKKLEVLKHPEVWEQSLLDLDLNHIVATSFSYCAGFWWNTCVLGPLEEKLYPQKCQSNFCPGFASAQMLIFTECPCSTNPAGLL